MAPPYLALLPLKPQPFYCHINLLDIDNATIAEVALADQTASGGKLPDEGYLSLRLDEDLHVQRILFIPWQTAFVTGLLQSKTPKADILAEVKRQGHDVVIGEWPEGSRDVGGHNNGIVFYSVSATDLLNAYSI